MVDISALVSGIFIGMISARITYPSASEVLDDLGEKVVHCLGLSVQRARADLKIYRQAFPQWVADQSERGLANWINDRLWAHLGELAEDVSTMDLIESGVTREVMVNSTYRIRLKRHGEDGAVASYATPTFLEFARQPSGQLPGLEETRLIAGYEWIKEQRSIGAGVISLRDGQENVAWQEVIPEIEDERGDGRAEILVPEESRPSGPTIKVPEGIGRLEEETAEEQ